MCDFVVVVFVVVYFFSACFNDQFREPLIHSMNDMNYQDIAFLFIYIECWTSTPLSNGILATYQPSNL